MLPDSQDAGYMWDMLKAACGIRDAVADCAFEDYEREENLRLAVERRFEIIGEAARRVSESFREAHAEIPWRRIIAQRNVLAHDYADVDDKLIWAVAREELPELIEQLELLVPPAPPEVDE